MAWSWRVCINILTCVIQTCRSCGVCATKELFRKTLTKQKRLLGEEDVNTLVTTVNLAITLNKQGRTADAEQLCVSHPTLLNMFPHALPRYSACLNMFPHALPDTLTCSTTHTMTARACTRTDSTCVCVTARACRCTPWRRVSHGHVLAEAMCFSSDLLTYVVVSTFTQ